ncbi:hypothetical protein [Streptomyces sp. NPDC090445]|uniref:hypothetical protein n=1 Tax=Streptomyces sp. NPDC090445 TaxID=3365963 RepID=UPI00382C29D5
MIMSGEVLPESWLSDAIGSLAGLVEAGGALIVFVGAAWAFGRFLTALVDRHERRGKYTTGKRRSQQTGRATWT